MRTILATVFVLIMSTVSQAAVKTERIEYKVGEVTFEGVLAYDDAATGKRPGVLVCHEWWGCNSYSESRARQLAELGYVAFALDMYGKGKTTTKADEASSWLQALMAAGPAVQDRAAAGLKVLAEQSRVDSSKLAAIGYCMGGTVALELARSGRPHTAELKAIVCFHTSNITAKDAAGNRNIKGSVLVCHGQADTFVKPEEIEKFHKQMAEAKVDYQFISYAAAVHAFTNPDAGSFGVPGVNYEPKADRRSWEAMKDLFKETFGG